MKRHAALGLKTGPRAQKCYVTQNFARPLVQKGIYLKKSVTNKIFAQSCCYSYLQ
jgi:hypothetical protein